MQTSATEFRYNLSARILHWCVAALVVVQISLGWASGWEDDRQLSFQLIRTHYQFGVLLFALMILRLSWRLAKGVPGPSPKEPVFRRRAAAMTHWGLYALLLTMPISGYVIWVWMDAPMNVFGIIDIPKLFIPPAEDETWRANAWYIHFYSSWVVIGLSAIHIAAALWHELVIRDRLVRSRML